MVGATALLGSWLLLASAEPPAPPEITRPVTDLADALSPAEEEAIARELVEHHEDTGVQLAVLVLDTTQPSDIADFSQRVFTAWGGGSAERDDGALFVLAISDRRSRLHLGYGLEPVIPDAAAQIMLDDLRPSLQDARYGDATMDLVREFRGRTAHLEPGEPVGLPLGALPFWWLVIEVVGLALGIAWGIVFSRELRKYGKEPAVGTKEHRKKPWTERAKLAVIGLSRRRAVRIAAGAIAAAQLCILALFFTGRGFAATYTLVMWLFVGAGWALVPSPRSIRITIGLALVLGLLVGIAVLDLSALHPDGSLALAAAAPGLLTFVIFGVSACWLVASVMAGGSGGSSYSSSGSSSYGSSSSSSYSSSSYSGGGGSSGGGGASSSW